MKTLNIILIFACTVAGIFFADVTIDIYYTPFDEQGRVLGMPQFHNHTFSVILYGVMALILFLIAAVNLWVYLESEMLEQHDN